MKNTIERIEAAFKPKYNTLNDKIITDFLWARTCFPFGSIEKWEEQIKSYIVNPVDENNNECDLLEVLIERNSK